MKGDKKRSLRILPLVKNCIKCGDKLTDHHFLCSNCWGKRCKRDVILQRRKIAIEGIIANRQKNNKYIPQDLLKILIDIKRKIRRTKKREGICR